MRVFVPGDRGAQALFVEAAKGGVQVRHLRRACRRSRTSSPVAVGEE